MLESKIQASCLKYAKSKGWYVLKIIKCNVNGFPDSVIFKDGKTIFVEFKSLIGKQSALQVYQQKQLEAQGFKYYLINNLKNFKEMLQINN
jgi:hypothetical protein